MGNRIGLDGKQSRTIRWKTGLDYMVKKAGLIDGIKDSRLDGKQRRAIR